MKTLTEVKSRFVQHKTHLFANYPIQSLAIFGSFAREENTDESDLDLLVEFSGNIGIRFVDLADEIEELLGVKIDLVSQNGIKEKYLKVIKPELIYV